MKKLALLLAALALIGCAVPQRTLSVTQFDGTKLTKAESKETGAQLLWGERHDAIALPGVVVTSGVEKKTMGVVAGGIGGGLIGLAAGNPAMGAVAGTVAGAIGDALEKVK